MQQTALWEIFCIDLYPNTIICSKLLRTRGSLGGFGLNERYPKLKTHFTVRLVVK